MDNERTVTKPLFVLAEQWKWRKSSPHKVMVAPLFSYDSNGSNLLNGIDVVLVPLAADVDTQTTQYNYWIHAEIVYQDGQLSQLDIDVPIEVIAAALGKSPKGASEFPGKDAISVSVQNESSIHNAKFTLRRSMNGSDKYEDISQSSTTIDYDCSWSFFTP
jgi:hypothetical protein